MDRELVKIAREIVRIKERNPKIVEALIKEDKKYAFLLQIAEGIVKLDEMRGK